MFQKLVSHNDDIKRLADKGYAVAVDSNCLVIRDIPYLDKQKQLCIGAIVSKMVFIDNEHVTQDDHQILFAGSVPHNLDGTPIPNLGGGPTQLALSEDSSDVVVQRSFSNKPRTGGKFKDFFEKIESYVTIVSGPAVELHRVTPYTFRSVQKPSPDSVFRFHDTQTSRAEITDLSARFKDDVVAVIGLGGTGAYVLDFLAKTPVREIRAGLGAGARPEPEGTVVLEEESIDGGGAGGEKLLHDFGRQGQFPRTDQGLQRSADHDRQTLAAHEVEKVPQAA
jgi:hypothetical protein